MRIFCLFFFCFIFVCSRASESPINIGVTAGGHGQNLNQAILAPTEKALKEAFYPRKVRIISGLLASELEKAIAEKRIDFFISTSALARRNFLVGITELLSITTDRFPDANHSFGSLFFVRKDSPIHTIKDLKGKILVANHDDGPFNYLAAMGELANQRINHEHFFKKKIFLNKTPHEVIAAVLNGKADVGTISSCFLEDHYAPNSRERKMLRGLELKATKPCMVSTATYPHWSFSVVAGVDPKLARQALKALLNLNLKEDGIEWSVATDRMATDSLLKNLQLGVYDQITSLEVEQFLKKYSAWILTFLISILVLSLHSVLVSRAVRKKTNELNREHAAQLSLIQKNREMEERFNSLQKIGLIGQMSSMLAHELAQPVSSIIAYTKGLLNFMDSGNDSKDVTKETLFKVNSEAQRVSGIVEKVRQYAKNRDNSPEWLEVRPVVQDAIELFQANGRYQGKLVFRLQSDVYASFVPMELEIAIANLLKNAADAFDENHTFEPIISITLKTKGRYCLIVVEDNAAHLDIEKIQAMRTPLKSTKPHGLGLGLYLAESIVQKHGGKLTLEPNFPIGLRAILYLPAKGEKL